MENKLSNLNMRIDVTCLLMLAYPFVDGCYRTTPLISVSKKLNTIKTIASIQNDQDQFKNFLKTETCFIEKPIISLFYLEKREALRQLRKSLYSSDKQGFLLVILGSEVAKTSEVKLMIYNNSKEGSKSKKWFLEFSTLLKIWDKRSNKKVCQYLLLILDFRYSGEWVEQLRFLERKDISIQSSMKTEKKRRYIKKEERVFLNNFLFANNLIGSVFRDPTPVYPKLNPAEHFEIKSPCFCGDPAIIAAVFGLNMGFNEWEEMKTAALFFPTNAFYIGQTSPVFDPLTNSVHRYPDGFGAIFRKNGEPICCGQYVCGFIGAQEIAKLSKESNSQSYTKVIHVDQYGSISYGRLKKNLLEGPSIVIDKEGNALLGNYHNNKLEGKGTLQTYYGAKWEGNFEHGIAKGFGNFTYPAQSASKNPSSSRRNVRYEVFNLKGSFAKFKVQGRLIQNSVLEINKTGNHTIGKFPHNLQEGEGLIFLPQGFIIEAEFSHGFINKLIKVTDVLLIKVPAELLTKTSNGKKFFIDKTGHAFFGTVFNGCEIPTFTASNSSSSIKSKIVVKETSNGNLPEKDYKASEAVNASSDEDAERAPVLSPPVLRVDDKSADESNTNRFHNSIKSRGVE